jgi:hypothetical protein
MCVFITAGPTSCVRGVCLLQYLLLFLLVPNTKLLLLQYRVCLLLQDLVQSC